MPTSAPSVATFADPRVTFPGDPRKSPTQAAQFWLRRDIIRGVFLPGERLKVDFLTRFYDVGHSPIREAILLLSGSGLVAHEHQKGHRVAPVSLADYQDVLGVYERIRKLALDMAMEIAGEDWEERVVLQLHRSRKVRHAPPSADPEARELWQRAYRDLYDVLVSGCGSPVLVQFYGDVAARVERYGNLYAELEIDLSRDHNAEHARIVDAVLDRDAARVQTLLDEYGRLAKPMRDSIVARLKAPQSANPRRVAKTSVEAKAPARPVKPVAAERRSGAGRPPRR